MAELTQAYLAQPRAPRLFFVSPYRFIGTSRLGVLATARLSFSQ